MSTWVDDHERKMLAMINTHGVAIQGVLGRGWEPSSAYTVGLAAREHPEVIVMGLPPATGQQLLNDLVRPVLGGVQVFEPGDVVHDLIAGFPACLIEVLDSREHLKVANRIYGSGGPVAALQLVFPDREGLWPWDEGSGVGGLPLLGPAVDLTQSRVVRLHW
jgi:hypothetical protein